MKRWYKILLIIAGAGALILVGGVSLIAGSRPFLGPRARTLLSRSFLRTPERLARGRYLVEAVTGCMDCHSPHDWSRHDAPATPGMEGAGQEMSSVLQGLPGRIVAPNLTPDLETGAGRWSDDALSRAIREGIGHDGRALFPMMPYEHFRRLPDEDVASIVVYLRSLTPVRNPLPETQVAFPVKYLIRAVPQPLADPVPNPDLSDPVKRGAFLVNVAACADCHTPPKNGQPLPGMDFAGGRLLEGPWGRVASANITPDASGIPYYDERQFVATLRTGYVGARRLNQIMPWATFRNMTDGDLKAMYAYLKTLPPVKHRVDNTEPPTYCPIDKSSHGLGHQNDSK
jgi:mono/diheme cytochrome c family protein